MSILNSISSAQDSIRNPFSAEVGTSFRKPDFVEGFVIKEIINGEEKGEVITLSGNRLPFQPFVFGGGQRVKKDYYSGHSKTNGKSPEALSLKEKRLVNKLSASTELQQQIDALRIRGNIVRISLGEWIRYAVISKVKFSMKNIADVSYDITFSIIGFNPPKNAKFIIGPREVPFAINKDLIAMSKTFGQTSIPKSVPRSIADILNDAISTVSGVLATVTGFVDSIVSTVQDIQKSVQRALGLIKYAQGKLNSYKKLVGAFKPFDPSQALTGRYENAKFYAGTLSLSASLTALLEKLKSRLKALVDSKPLSRHLVISGDNLQKVAVKYYGSADNWKKIYDFNNLSSTALTIGSTLEIPRL
jgi:LysM repeat protein